MYEEEDEKIVEETQRRGASDHSKQRHAQANMSQAKHQTSATAAQQQLLN